MFRGTKSVIVGLLALLAVLPLLAACDVGGGSSSQKPKVIVASKAFTEETLIGEMYAQLLEQGGYPVERKLNLGETNVLQEALVKGDISLYPEYTGTGLTVVLKHDASSDAKQVYDTVSTEYQDKFKLTWLDPAPMNNTQGLAVTQATADRLGLKTLTDLATKAADLRLACAPAFVDRPDGLPGLQKTYGGYQFKDVKQVDFALFYPTLLNGDVDVTEAFGTDGEIEGNKLVFLEDDKKLFPIYQIAPLIRTDLVTANPDLKTILNPLAPKLTDATMRRINWEVAGKKREPADVAKEFLKAEGLLK
jgi:osmoprotectant transport system substrate-binding protein